MTYLARGLKEDLQTLAEDLGVDVQPNFRVIDLKNAILGSTGYDEEFCKERLNTIMSVRKEKMEEQRRGEEMQLKLEELKARIESKENVKTEREDKNPGREFRNVVHKFVMGEDINLYLVLFERQARRVSLPREEWVTHLLGLPPYEINQLIA